MRTGRTSICEPGQERADADVHREAALDALDDAADDDLALGIGLLDLVPDLHLLGFFAREHDVAVAIFGALEQHVDRVARLHGHFAALVEKFVDADDAFGFVADVDDDFGRGDFEDRALHHLAFRDVAEAVIVDVEHPGKFLRVGVVIFEGGQDALPLGFPTRPCRCAGDLRGGFFLSALVVHVHHALKFS